MVEEDPLAGILGNAKAESLANNIDGALSPRRYAPDGSFDPEFVSSELLLAACKENDTSRARELLADGVPPGCTDPESGWSCLHWAAYKGNPVLALALVHAGASRSYQRASTTLSQGRKSQHGRSLNCANGSVATDTPLHWSAYRGDLRITWILLKEGYSPNDVDNTGNTVTHLAAANGHERVLDTLIRDGADVHRQNKFKNTPWDVASSAECRRLLKTTAAFPAPSVEEAEAMHRKNLQRILEAEQTLIEAVDCLEEPLDEQRQQEVQQKHRDGREGDEEKVVDQEGTKAGGDGGVGSAAARETEGSSDDVEAESKTNSSGGDIEIPNDNDNKSEGGARGGGRGGGGEQKDDETKEGVTGDAAAVDRATADRNYCAAPDAKGAGNDRAGNGKSRRVSVVPGNGRSRRASVMPSNGRNRRVSVVPSNGRSKRGSGVYSDGRIRRESVVPSGGRSRRVSTVPSEGRRKQMPVVPNDGSEKAAGEAMTSLKESTGINEDGDALLARVEHIREAIAGAEALCICDELVETAKLKIDGLLLQHSIEKQAARVAAASPVLTQEIYTTLVNRLTLLLKRAEGNPRITGKLRGRAKVLVAKSHAEYWLQVAAHRLEIVECAKPRHLNDMAKLEAAIDQATKAGAQADLVKRCRVLLGRLTTEVEISKAAESFPKVRLPIEVIPKDYWQPEDVGFIEETDGYPLPPSDEGGRPLEYIWIPSKSLRELSTACKRMAEALVGGEGLNPALVERGSKRLHEAQKELRVLQEKDAGDKEKAVSQAAKAAKKLKKGKGKKKKK